MDNKEDLGGTKRILHQMTQDAYTIYSPNSLIKVNTTNLIWRPGKVSELIKFGFCYLYIYQRY